MLIKYNSFLLYKFRSNIDIFFRIKFCKDCKKTIFTIDYLLLKEIEINFFIGNLELIIMVDAEDYNNSYVYIKSLNKKGLSFYLFKKEYKNFNKKITKFIKC